MPCHDPLDRHRRVHRFHTAISGPPASRVPNLSGQYTGTYRSRDAATSASVAASAGCPLIDTAPVYGKGSHQSAIAPVLQANPDLKVSSKVGYMTPGQATVALTSGALAPDEAKFLHSISPEYVRHQVAMSRVELRRDQLDIVYLHNPEHHYKERGDLHSRIREAFSVLEEEVSRGTIRGYGVSTWTGFESEAFTVRDLTLLAREAAGEAEPSLTAIQLPVSMVRINAVRQSLARKGPIAEGAEAGLDSWASAPLHGGELAQLIRPKLAEAVSPGASGIAAALKFVASVSGLTGMLISSTNASHWQEAAEAIRDPLPETRLKELCELLDPAPERPH